MFFVTLKKYRAAVAELATLSDELAYSQDIIAAKTRAFDELMEAAQDGLRELSRVTTELHTAKMEVAAARQSAASAGRNAQFTPEQLRTLLQLCHPDKHGGKESAVQITQHINSLRK